MKVSVVVWRREAADEVREAEAWYGAIRSALADRFLDSVRSAVSAIQRWPGRFPLVGEGCRRAQVEHFPHGLLYLVDGSRVVIVSCFHPKRDPGDWQGRVV